MLHKISKMVYDLQKSQHFSEVVDLFPMSYESSSKVDLSQFPALHSELLGFSLTDFHNTIFELNLELDSKIPHLAATNFVVTTLK